MIELACKTLIEHGKTQGLSEKMGLFLLVGQLTNEKYVELMEMLTAFEAGSGV